MNNSIIVPVDLTQEEREVLAIFSKRQFMIILPAFVIGMGFFIVGNIPFIDGFVDFLIRGVILLLIMAVAIALSFVKLDKYEQYLSEFLTTMYKFRKSQKTFYHWP